MLRAVWMLPSAVRQEGAGDKNFVMRGESCGFERAVDIFPRVCLGYGAAAVAGTSPRVVCEHSIVDVFFRKIFSDFLREKF